MVELDAERTHFASERSTRLTILASEARSARARSASSRTNRRNDARGSRSRDNGVSATTDADRGRPSSKGDLPEVVARDQSMDHLAARDHLRLPRDGDEERVSRLPFLDHGVAGVVLDGRREPATFFRCRLDRVSNSGTAAMTVSSFAFANVTSSGDCAGKA